MESLREIVSGQAVLVTGAHGLLGSAIVRKILGVGARVAVISRSNPPASALNLGGEASACRLFEGDVSDAEFVRFVFASTTPSVVVHLAGVSVVGDARLSPRDAIESSVVGTLNVLEESRSVSPRAVAVASSDKAYGESAELPYRETMPLDPKFPYEAAKAATDVVARSYWHSYGLPVSVIRSANLYGPGDSNLSRLVPHSIAAILSDTRPVVRSHGRTERDYVYVDDAAEAYLSVIQLLASRRGCGEAFNVGSGVPRSTLEVVEEILRVAGSDLTPEIQGTGVPEGEIERQVIDSSKLEAATGWRAATPLDEGLAATLAWYREHPASLGI